MDNCVMEAPFTADRMSLDDFLSVVDRFAISKRTEVRGLLSVSRKENSSPRARAPST